MNHATPNWRSTSAEICHLDDFGSDLLRPRLSHAQPLRSPPPSFRRRDLWEAGTTRTARHPVASMIALEFAAVIVLQSVISGHLVWPWDFALSLNTHTNYVVNFVHSFLNRSSWYIVIWLLPLGLVRIREFHARGGGRWAGNAVCVRTECVPQSRRRRRWRHRSLHL